MGKKQLLRAVCFIVLACALLWNVTNLLRDRTTTLASFYSEPDGTVEAIIVGSSHVNASYIPAVLWQEYGIAAHNVYSWSQPIWISYHYIREALKTQQPKVVVLELFGMTYGHSYIMPEEIDRTNYANSFSIDPGLNFYQMIQTVGKDGIDLRSPGDFLNLVRYHSRWKYLNEEAFTYNAHKRHSSLKSYGFLTQHTPMGEQLPWRAVVGEKEPYETALAYLDKIVALAEKEGFSLVFTLSPYAYNEVELEIFNYLDSYAAAHGIPLLNYCTVLAEEAGFDYATDMADTTHTNHSGAMKITRHLGAFLQQNYSFTAPGEIAGAAQQDVDARKAYRTFEVAERLLETDTLSFLQWVAGDDGTTLLLAMGEGVQALDAGAATALGNLFPAQNEGYLAAIYRPQEGLSAQATVAEGAVRQQLELGGYNMEIQSGPAGAAGYVNGAPLLHSGSAVAFLWYDEILERPVAAGWLSEDGLALQLEELPASMFGV